MPFLEDTLAFGAPVPMVVLAAISTWMAWLAVVGAWDRRGERLWAPVILFVIIELGYRIVFLPTHYHDWYVPPFTAMAILLVAAGAERVARATAFVRGPVLAGAVVAFFAVPLPWVFSMERAIQVEVGDGVRTPLALSLAALVKPGESVITEAPGYLGYLSSMKVMDYPGLTSRATLAVVQRLPPERRSLESLIDALRPDWVVLRPIELDYFVTGYPDTAAQYREVRRFGSPIDEIERFWYRKMTVDGAFIILRRDS